MNPTTILLSAGILGGVGFGFAALIALAHRRFYVWEDPRIDGVTSRLPGNNCGACGLPGCRAFAEQLVLGKTIPAGCTVSNADGRQEIADYLGIEVGSVAQRVARLLCAGGHDVSVQNAEYLGIETCAAAAAVAGGGKGCSWGCLGLADCARSCTFDAIWMNDVGIPVVRPDKCTACNDCVEACPKDLFVILPIEQHLIVQCRNLLEGDAATAVCQVACNGCQRCAADAPGLISIQNGLAVIDYSQNSLASPVATARCPTGAIVWVDGAQFQGSTQPLEGAAS